MNSPKRTTNDPSSLIVRFTRFAEACTTAMGKQRLRSPDPSQQAAGGKKSLQVVSNLAVNYARRARRATWLAGCAVC
jgi:hypothetical protein